MVLFVYLLDVALKHSLQGPMNMYVRSYLIEICNLQISNYKHWYNKHILHSFVY